MILRVSRMALRCGSSMVWPNFSVTYYNGTPSLLNIGVLLQPHHDGQ
ncbi:hypothetical protein JOE11_005473 [Robbsia andropogonis]